MPRQKMRHIPFASALALALSSTAFAQTSATTVTFDIVSIKPTSSGPYRPNCTGDRFTTSSPLDYLIRWAFELGRPFITGVPGWVSDVNHRYAIEAKAGAPMTAETCKAMVRSMFVNQFEMVTHREQRTMAAYALVVAKSGPKMRKATGETDVATINDLHFASDDARLTGATMQQLAAALSGFDDIGAPVVDRTGLKGRYAFRVSFSSNSTDLPSLWTALEEQLGLKLEPIRAQIDVLVVDHIERPAAN